MDNPDTADRWKYTLDLLTLMQLSTLPCAAGGVSHGYRKSSAFVMQGNRGARLARSRSVHLHIVEKYSDSTITVCWRDATSGCYGEQLWKVVTARARSTCALSGLQIRPGDTVFRPWARGYRPANRDSMILASAVQVNAME